MTGEDYLNIASCDSEIESLVNAISKAIVKALSSDPSLPPFSGSVDFERNTAPLNKLATSYLFNVKGLSATQRKHLLASMENNFGELSVELLGRGFAGAKHYTNNVANTASLLHLRLSSGADQHATPEHMSALVESQFPFKPTYVAKVSGGKISGAFNHDMVDRVITLPQGPKLPDGFYALVPSISYAGLKVLHEARAGQELQVGKDSLTLFSQRIHSHIPSSKLPSRKRKQAEKGSAWGKPTAATAINGDESIAPPGQKNGDLKCNDGRMLLLLLLKARFRPGVLYIFIASFFF